ncbi:MAG TPA: hypothetical protein VK206_26430 [Anaerolineales bacterium]|nr:hypothetical protein [Anaerolineales bacterium]
MSNIQPFWRFSWRSILVALGYLAGLILAGMIGAMLGEKLSSAGKNGTSSFAKLFVASLLLGVFLGPFASRLALSRGQHFILWGSLILFNLGSLMIEGAYFAPDMVSIPIPMLVTQQLLATAGAALVITRVFTTPGQSAPWSSALRTRSWYSWIWRFIASAMSYLVFYFVIGGLNYQLVTKPYYESHVGGLTIPAPGIVFIVESIRGLLIVFSVFLFLLSARGTRRQLMVSTGWLLFAIGGIIPLILQIGTLPLFLLIASAMEIFFQNFLTGVMAAMLLGVEDPGKSEAAILVEQGVP